MELDEELGVFDHVKPGIENQSTREEVNIVLKRVLSRNFITPYAAVHAISKVLANYSVILPKTFFLNGGSGSYVFDVSQFGNVTGMNNDGKVYTKTPQLSIVFSYDINDKGMFFCTAKVVDNNSESLYE